MDKIYVIKFDSRSATLYDQNGCYVRRYLARSGKSIATASVHNAGRDSMITLNYTDGHADVYKWDGAIYRQL